MQSHKGSPVAHVRAEILDLIGALRSHTRRTPGPSPNGSIPAPFGPLSVPASRPNGRNYGELLDHIYELRRQLNGAQPKPSVPPVVRGLEQRLTLLEERVYTQKKPSLSPPEKGSERE